MTSLTDVYDGDVGSVAGTRRRALGTALFLAGAVLVVAAIATATTGLREVVSLDVYAARRVAGVLAGVGLPAVFVGIFAVLPAGRVVLAAAAIGASLALLGVALFTYAYPDRWVSVDPGLTVATVLIYGLGTLTTVWCMFAALATFKTRNDPGGTARMEITEEGTIRIIQQESSLPGFGSVGLFGRDPDGSVETQTNRAGQPSAGSAGHPRGDGGATVLKDDGGSAATAGPTPHGAHPNATSDGGTAVESAGVDAVDAHGSPDRYCGNCTHFEYVRVGDDLAPYCGLHDEVMDDMDACERWDANR